MLFDLIYVYYVHLLCAVRVTQSLIFCALFCRSLFVLLAITLSVLLFMASDYPVGIFKLFFILRYMYIQADNRQNERRPVPAPCVPAAPDA